MWHERMNTDPDKRTTLARICRGFRQAVRDNPVDHNFLQRDGTKEFGDTPRPSISVKH
jgi:hypothetical protein